jgi:DNA primase
MPFPQTFLDEIRARIPVSEIVGKRVKLRKQGREWVGLSPFNSEKTPSFFVNDNKGFYHDFSSGAHGDVFKFLMDTEGLSFPDAVERLASMAGVSLPANSPEAEQREAKRRSLYEILEMACQFFESRLRSTIGASAREYLDKRSIVSTTRTEFRLGFAPDGRDSLKYFLLQNGLEEKQLQECGLIIIPEDGRESYDRFRNRIMIPIQDSNGRVVGFGGRGLSTETKPKYLNSPETELFHKGELIFNSHRARSPAKELGTIVVVEGYLDAISVFQAGFKAIVATLGTAITPEHIKLLWRFGSEPVICFDGDKAGRAAAHRAIDQILPLLGSGQSFNFAFLPENQDPDDVIKIGGISKFRQVLETADSMWDVLWRRETANTRIAKPEHRAELEKRLQALTSLIPDSLVRKHYKLKVRLCLMDLFWKYDRLNRSVRAGRTVSYLYQSELIQGGPTRGIGAERIFLGLCVAYPENVVDRIEPIDALKLRGGGPGLLYKKFLDDLISICNENENVTTDLIYTKVCPEFYFIIEEVHGRKTASLPSGHRLLSRLPILKTHPGPDFIVKVFKFYIDFFQLRDMEDELAAIVKDYPAEPYNEVEEQLIEERLLARQSEILNLRERIRHDENSIAEEGANWKTLAGQNATVARLVA